MHTLIVIDISGEKQKSLYANDFKTHPRIGEWVEIDIEGKGVIYEVVRIIHSSKGLGSDIYVKLVGLTPAVVKSLVQKNENQ